MVTESMEIIHRFFQVDKTVFEEMLVALLEKYQAVFGAFCHHQKGDKGTVWGKQPVGQLCCATSPDHGSDNGSARSRTDRTGQDRISEPGRRGIYYN